MLTPVSPGIIVFLELNTMWCRSSYGMDISCRKRPKDRSPEGLSVALLLRYACKVGTPLLNHQNDLPCSTAQVRFGKVKEAKVIT